MRWTLAAVLALVFSAYSWGQASPPEFSSSLRVDPAVLSPTPEDIARRLWSLSTALSSEARAQSIELAALNTSLQESRLALESCMRSLEEARISLLARNAELWLWRGATAVSLIGLASVAVFAVSR